MSKQSILRLDFAFAVLVIFICGDSFGQGPGVDVAKWCHAKYGFSAKVIPPVSDSEGTWLCELETAVYPIDWNDACQVQHGMRHGIFGDPQRQQGVYCTNDPQTLGCGKEVKLVYFVPRNAPFKNRAHVMLAAYRQIQEQWATWGWHFRINPEVVTIAGDHGCSGYASNETLVLEFRRKLGASYDPDRFIFAVFGECTSDPHGVAAASREGQSYLGFVVDGIGQGRLPEIGNIGHELGHTFDLPHEDCRVTNGVMCNNRWPSVYPTAEQFGVVARSFRVAQGFMASCEL